MKPYIIIHSALSLDAKISGFQADLEAYYQVLPEFEEQAALCGSETIINATPKEYNVTVDLPDEEVTFPALIITDSSGRVKSWDYWMSLGMWKSYIALCSESTPEKHIDYLKSLKVKVIISGREKVDLNEALSILHKQFGIEKIRTDCGSRLNSLLYNEGLVDEISLILHPVFSNSPDLENFINPKAEHKLELAEARELRNGIVWLRYKVK
jgi:2,5-diamino-6-(ribosylamino)-4(3H)-pyrimidinone 5'-phosphate reductase